MRGHTQPVWSVVFDAAGSRVVTASFDNEARIWDARDGSLLRVLPGHSEALWAAHFVADGRVVTASEDNTIRVWSSDADAPTLVLSGHRDAVTKLGVSADGQRLLSGSADGNLQLWDLSQLETNTGVLAHRLANATIWCLDVERRERELGEDPDEAALARARCAQTYARAR